MTTTSFVARRREFNSAKAFRKLATARPFSGDPPHALSAALIMFSPFSGDPVA